jgi:Right handed beta helix region
VPANAIRVTNTADFIKQFTSSGAKDIVLADGTYDNANPVQAAAPHRVWAARVGGAKLTFGLGFESSSSSSGAAVHGIVFDISSASKTSQSAAIRIANAPNSGITLQDISINGNRTIAAGIQAYNSSGLVIQRCVVSNVFDYGVFLQSYGSVAYTYVPNPAPVVEDCDIKNVYRDARASNSGRSEACLWVGVTATVNRVRVQNCGWMGMFTGSNANSAKITNVIVLDTDIGIYVEHWTRNTTFERFQIGPLTGLAGPAGFKIRTGINTEWADPAYAGKNPITGQSLGASQSDTFRSGFINSYLAGIFTGDAEKTTVAGVKFLNQRFAAIGEHRGSSTGYNMTWENLGNDFSALTSGVPQYTRQHINSYSGPLP